MKIFQAALLAAAVSAIQLADGELDELKTDLKADLGLTDADIAAFESKPPKDQKKMLKEMAADLGADGEGLVDDIKEALELELGEKKMPSKEKLAQRGRLLLAQKKAKKGGDDMSPPCSEDDDDCWAEVEAAAKEAGITEKDVADALELAQKKGKKDDGDMSAPCSEDDDDCWAEVEAALKEEGITEKEVADALELGEDGDKPAPKKGEKPPPKGEEGEDMEPPCSEDDDECWAEVEDAIRKEMKDAGMDDKEIDAALDMSMDLEDLEGLELGEDGDKPAPKKGEKPPPKGSDGEDMEPPCSEDDDECWAEVMDALRAEMKDAGMDDKEIDAALDASMDLEDIEAEAEAALELGEDGKKPPKKEGGDLEAEAAAAIREFDADGSGKISADEGKEVLKAVGFSEDVAGMIVGGLGEELDEEPTAEEIVEGAKELGEFIAKKEGVSADEVADFVGEIDFSKVTKEDVEEFVAYLEEEE